MHLKFHQNVASMSFNRYMVECESYISILSFILCPGFNRYMVECE